MTKPDYPITPAVRFLREQSIDFVPHLYSYEGRGVTRHAALALDVDEHSIVKTLVLQTDARQALLMLMHGDCEVSMKQLARTIGAKSVTSCNVQAVQRYTGYMTGGVSPFGTRMPLPIYCEATILELERIYINGGKRGFLVELNPADMQRVLAPQIVSVAIKSG